MRLQVKGSFRLLFAVLFFAACGQGPSQTPASPSSGDNRWKGTGVARIAPNPGPGGGVQIMAAGDVQNGPIEIREVRIRRGTPGNQADVHPNALAGMVLRVPPGQEIEMWVTWSSSSALATPPRLVIDFGDGWVDNISCGSCLLRHAYNRDGRFTVKVLMDDRVSGTTTRTFALDVGAKCGSSVATSFDAIAVGTAGSALGVPGLSAPALTVVIPAFPANTSGNALIAFVGDGDIDLAFSDPQSVIQVDYAYQTGFPGTLTIFDDGGSRVVPLVGVSDGAGSDIGHISLTSSSGISRIVLGNGSNGVMVDNLSTTATCLF